MSPQEIRNRKLYLDRFVQEWHRMTFPPDCWAIDIDLVGVCPRCRRPLYFLEATTNPRKPTTILRNIETADAPGILVIHDTHRLVEARWISGPDDLALIGGEESLIDTLWSIRRRHAPLCPRSEET